MWNEEGLFSSSNDVSGNIESLAALTRLMDLSCQIAGHAVSLYDTTQTALGMTLMESADHLADEVGVWAGRCGYTMDEVTAPLWE